MQLMVCWWFVECLVGCVLFQMFDDVVGYIYVVGCFDVFEFW